MLQRRASRSGMVDSPLALVACLIILVVAGLFVAVRQSCFPTREDSSSKLTSQRRDLSYSLKKVGRQVDSIESDVKTSTALSLSQAASNVRPANEAITEAEGHYAGLEGAIDSLAKHKGSELEVEAARKYLASGRTQLDEYKQRLEKLTTQLKTAEPKPEPPPSRWRFWR